MISMHVKYLIYRWIAKSRNEANNFSVPSWYELEVLTGEMEKVGHREEAEAAQPAHEKT